VRIFEKPNRQQQTLWARISSTKGSSCGLEIGKEDNLSKCSGKKLAGLTENQTKAGSSADGKE
jgi:hypothetical protein